MLEEQQRILQMVQDGILTAQEAEVLLKTLDETTEPVEPEDEVPLHAITLGVPPKDKAPNMDQFRRHWEIPFAAGIILFGVSGLCVSGSRPGFVVFGGWTLLLVSILVIVIGMWSRTSPWIHIRIREQDGGRFFLSLPLPPYGVMEALLRFSQRFSDADTRENLDVALSFVAGLKENPPDEPVSIQVDDEDGDHVQVFVG